MRLINTTTLDTEVFFGEDIPKYAILSHTWGDEEVTLRQWQERRKKTVARLAGCKKIVSACKQALEDSHQWLWVDTNCIDKTSSAELTEAINSMYSWYRNSEVCYAYLADVGPAADGGQDSATLKPLVEDSRWFTRGWTLQELLAPEDVIFFSAGWTKIGTRYSLGALIEATTGIHNHYLNHLWDLNQASVATKMSWASKRSTTRAEDIAYSLLGLFGVNMPLLYGEGTRAFTRLQEEIIKLSDDHTIFCWDWNDNVPANWAGLLAPSPDTFSGSQVYARLHYSRSWDLAPYTITNMGVSVTLPLIHTASFFSFLILNVSLGSNSHLNACLAVEHYAYSETLFRRKFPGTPILLLAEAADRPNDSEKLTTYSMIVTAKHEMVPRRRIHLSSNEEFSLLLFAQPAYSKMFHEGSPIMGHGWRGWALDLHCTDYGNFNADTAILGLTPKDIDTPGGRKTVHLAVMRIRLRAETRTATLSRSHDFWIAFAALKLAPGHVDNKEIWHCGVYCPTHIEYLQHTSKIGQKRKHTVHEVEAQSQVEWVVQTMTDEVIANRIRQQHRDVTNGTLHVQIGGTGLMAYPSMKFRAASISGSEACPCPLPWNY